VIRREPGVDGKARLVLDCTEELAADLIKAVTMLGPTGLLLFSENSQVVMDLVHVLDLASDRPVSAELEIEAVPGRPARSRLLIDARASNTTK
jgi:hypothetical protein